MKRESKLTDWKLENYGSGYWLVGKVFDTEPKRFPDGYDVHTSTLLNIDFTTMKAETKNTVYNLV